MISIDDRRDGDYANQDGTPDDDDPPSPAEFSLAGSYGMSAGCTKKWHLANRR